MVRTPRPCLWLALFAALLLSAVRPASAQYAASPLTQLSMHGDPGAYIGGGQDYLYNANDGSFTTGITVNSVGKATGVYIYFSQGNGGDTWNLSFASTRPSSQGDPPELTPGAYTQAERAPFESAGHPGLDVSGNGAGSNNLTGKFTVTEAVYDYSTSPPTLVSFAATFEQHSDSRTPALTGTLYYHSNTHPPVAATSHPATTAALTGTIGKYGRYAGPVQVALSATDPDGAGDVAATYYTIDSGPVQTYSAPFSITADGMHAVRFHSVDQTGNREIENLQTVWIDTSPPPTVAALNRIILHSQPGDYIGGGNDYLYNDSDGQFTATTSSYTSGGQSSTAANDIRISFNTPGA